MKSNKKLIYIILILVCLNLAAICVFLALWDRASEIPDTDNLDELRSSIKQFETTAPSKPALSTAAAETSGAVTEEPIPDTGEPESADTQSVDASALGNLDFEKLWEVNPEICAWLEIPGTRIDYPVLQSPDNDKKYLSTAYDGSPYIGGALFTEATYNAKDFNDPVTVIYGHTMRSGNLFGTLQKTYSSEKTFNECSVVKLYLPGETREYTVFAAVPYSKIHLLHTYDFETRYWYERFFNDTRDIREIGVNINEEIHPEAWDRVIIMSVCLNQDTTRRFLVMAVYNEDLADNTQNS